MLAKAGNLQLVPRLPPLDRAAVQRRSLHDLLPLGDEFGEGGDFLGGGSLLGRERFDLFELAGDASNLAGVVERVRVPEGDGNAVERETMEGAVHLLPPEGELPHAGGTGSEAKGVVNGDRPSLLASPAVPIEDERSVLPLREIRGFRRRELAGSVGPRGDPQALARGRVGELAENAAGARDGEEGGGIEVAEDEREHVERRRGEELELLWVKTRSALSSRGDKFVQDTFLALPLPLLLRPPALVAFFLGGAGAARWGVERGQCQVRGSGRAGFGRCAVLLCPA